MPGHGYYGHSLALVQVTCHFLLLFFHNLSDQLFGNMALFYKLITPNRIRTKVFTNYLRNSCFVIVKIQPDLPDEFKSHDVRPNRYNMCQFLTKDGCFHNKSHNQMILNQPTILTIDTTHYWSKYLIIQTRIRGFKITGYLPFHEASVSSLKYQQRKNELIT